MEWARQEISGRISKAGVGELHIRSGLDPRVTSGGGGATHPPHINQEPEPWVEATDTG